LSFYRKKKTTQTNREKMEN